MRHYSFPLLQRWEADGSDVSMCHLLLRGHFKNSEKGPLFVLITDLNTVEVKSNLAAGTEDTHGTKQLEPASPSTPT